MGICYRTEEKTAKDNPLSEFLFVCAQNRRSGTCLISCFSTKPETSFLFANLVTDQKKNALKPYCDYGYVSYKLALANVKDVYTVLIC